MKNLTDITYDRDGGAWQPIDGGRTLIYVKRPPKTVKLAPVPGEHGFFAHVDGHVFTAWRNRGHRTKRAKAHFKALTVVEVTDGRVQLYNGTARLDETALETFVGPKPEGAEAVHVDGDAENCAIENLRWRKRPAEAIMPVLPEGLLAEKLFALVRDKPDLRSKVAEALDAIKTARNGPNSDQEFPEKKRPRI